MREAHPYAESVSRHRDRHSPRPKRTWRQRYPDPGRPIIVGLLDPVVDFVVMPTLGANDAAAASNQNHSE